MVEHLKPGGLLLVEPFLRPGEWRSPSVHLQTYRSDDIVIARVSRSTKRAPNIAIIDDHFMVGRSRRPVERFESHHELAMFEPRLTLAILRDAGVSVRYLSRGLMPGGALRRGKALLQTAHGLRPGLNASPPGAAGRSGSAELGR